MRAYDVLENDILGWILDEAYSDSGICHDTRRLNVYPPLCLKSVGRIQELDEHKNDSTTRMRMKCSVVVSSYASWKVTRFMEVCPPLGSPRHHSLFTYLRSRTDSI